MVDLWKCHYAWSFTYTRKRRNKICQSCCYLKTCGMMEQEIIFNGTPFTVFTLRAILLSF
ncbi:hypothetical protein ERO13_A10G231175v2 [Gossypium hirsutum]|nr:hypothetical protein ERO13_A10G231175v2 [Gossypium hirsutum]